MEKKNITKKDRQELAKAITESKEFNDFIKVIAKDVRSKSCEYLKHHPNKNKSHDCNELVPFRWKHFLISALDNQRFCYELDPRVKGKRHSQDKIHFKLYYDIVEWFWNNADEVLDYKEDYPRLKVTKKNKKLLSKPIADGLRELNISAFITKNKVEFLFHDAWLVLHMAPKRAEKLNQWLVSRGWPNYSVVCPEECPAFYIQKTDHDQIIVLNSLIEWNSYSQVDKEQIIQKYKKLGFKFYEKARNIKMRECKTKISLNPGDFKVVELPLKSTKHYLL